MQYFPKEVIFVKQKMKILPFSHTSTEKVAIHNGNTISSAKIKGSQVAWHLVWRCQVIEVVTGHIKWLTMLFNSHGFRHCNFQTLRTFQYATGGLTEPHKSFAYVSTNIRISELRGKIWHSETTKMSWSWCLFILGGRLVNFGGKTLFSDTLKLQLYQPRMPWNV